MKTGAGLALIAVGAILAFAVRANTSFFNLNIAGWVLMIIGLIGILLPRSGYNWLGRRLMVRRSYPTGRVEQVPVPPYAARNPGTAALQAGQPSRPTLLDQDIIEPSEPPASAGGRPVASTEVIEDLYEQP